MQSPRDVLARLKDSSENGPVAKLAALIVDDALATPIEELLDVALVAKHLQGGLRAMTSSDAAAKAIVDRVEAALKDLAGHGGHASDLLPGALVDGAKAIVALPFSPDRAVVKKLVDREPMQKLLRAQVVEMLVEFGRKATSPVADNAVARGIGGFLGQLASASPLGSIASAVSSEVERQVEKRASEFADTAVESILAGIADQMSDPARANEQAALRTTILDGALELTGPEIAGVFRGHAAAHVTTLRKALAAWSADDAFLADVTSAIEKLLAPEMKRPLGDVLADLALRDAARDHAREVVRRGLGRLVCGDAFAAWLDALLSE